MGSLAFVGDVEGGGLAFGQQKGPVISSASAEAIGLYAGLAVPGPLRIHLDNSSVVRRMQQLLRDESCKKPWGMQPDGDAWQEIDNNIRSRPAHSIEVTKVKGTLKIITYNRGSALKSR